MTEDTTNGTVEADKVADIVDNAYGRGMKIKARGSTKGGKTKQRKGMLLDRVDMLETNLNEMYKSHVFAANAINRSEQFLFCLIKHLMDDGLVTLQKLSEYMDELHKHKTLDTFWECTLGEGDEEVDVSLCESPEAVIEETIPTEEPVKEEEDDSSVGA